MPPIMVLTTCLKSYLKLHIMYIFVIILIIFV